MACHAQFEDAIVKLKSSKDLSAFGAATKKVNTDHKTETQAITDLANSLKGSDAADKVAELQKLDRYYIHGSQSKLGLVEVEVHSK